MLDIECQEATKFIKLPFFLDALKFSPLNKGSESTKVFFRLLDDGLPLHFNEPGYCFDNEKIPKGDVKCALLRINRALFETDIPEMKLFAQEVITTEAGNEITMAGILIGREDVRQIYAKMEFDSYPWVKLPWPQSEFDFGDYPIDRHAKSEKKQRTRKVNLTQAIHAAVNTFKKKPSFDELWQFFQDDKDETGIIEDFTDTHITWKDTKGKLHDTQKSTIANHLSQIKS